jgi:hypothetical protein
VTISETSDCAPLRQREEFAETLRLLIVCAGNPTFESVAKWATALQRQRNPEMPAVSNQRISDA